MKEETKRETIKPELLGGFKDYLPDIMIFRQDVFDKIRQTFELFGFLPLETPGLERSSVLGTDKDEFKMDVYRFGDDFEGVGQDVTLRFDLTVPLSRVVAANPQLLKPFKRYQRGSVWRKEKPQAGRFREFTQFDADIVGSDSILSDTEIVLLMYQTFINLDVSDFTIRFNNRKILNGLPEVAKFDADKAGGVFRVLDKLDKIGIANVAKELERVPDNRFDETALALNNFSIDKIKEFLSLKGENQKLLASARNFFKDVAVAEEGLAECEMIMQNLSALGIPEKFWKFDLSIARGLGYYTGPVFETTLNKLPKIGSVFSGGRYDDLVARYTGEKIPAVGASIGVDRLIAALEKISKIEKKKSTAKVIISLLDDKFSLKVLKVADKLRSKGVNTEIYFGKGALKDQIIYAAKREIPFFVILGENEDAAGNFRLKDMRKRTEEVLTEGELFDRLI